MRISMSVCVVVASLSLVSFTHAATFAPEEQKVLEVILRMPGNGTALLDEKATGKARMIAKFDRLSDLDLTKLKGCPLIVELEVIDASRCTDRGMDLIRSLPNLERLTLQKPAITDKGMIAFKSMPRLKSLYFAESRITESLP